ncbi:hypothetical protein [Sphingopyxis sp. UBA6734]|uniref:hypothetical protein n=1 Tax=Sphingopyxis sp. UBA6734 TaxID=1947539 RepID=UPI0026011CA4|nr:hypothetical protein [Sphingopyxis sp. UBA6734]
MSERRIVALLREGWDYSSEVAGAFDEWGMFRAPHLGILAGLSREAYPRSPLLHMDMSISEIESGLYRQCRIMPDEPKAGSIPSSTDYAVANCPHYEPDREWIFQALIGHTPRDLARLLHVYNRDHRRVGKFLLAKDFRAAFALAPELRTREGWPDEVTRFWRNRDIRRILAPADALCAHAEFARLAMNDRGMCAMAYRDDGIFMTMRQGIDSITAGPSSEAVTTNQLQIDRLLEMMPLQTTILLPPTCVFAERDSLMGGAWSLAAASHLPQILLECGDELPDILRGTSEFEARLTQDNLRAHPAAWFEKHGGQAAWSQNRPAVTLWSLDRRQNVAVNLIEISRFCDAASLPPSGDRNTSSYRTSKKDLANLIKTVTLIWLVDARPAAADPSTGELKTGFRKRSGKASCEDFETLDDICRLKEFGRRACKIGQEKANKRLRSGRGGFSAQGHPHLWFRDDGDDLGHYRKLQLQAVAENLGLQSGSRGFPLGSSASVIGRGPWAPHFSGRPKFSPGRQQQGCSMTLDIEAAYCSRDHAMMITAHPTDPMHEFLSRPIASIDRDDASDHGAVQSTRTSAVKS